MNALGEERGNRWWACYSFKQQAVHVECEGDALAKNLRAFEDDIFVDFVPLAVFTDEDVARVFLSGVQAIRNQRQQPGGGKWN